MTTIKKLAAAAAVATLALAATDLSASAQSSLTNDPTAATPNHAMYRQRPVHTVRSADGSHRALTVRRTVAAVEAPVVVVPAPVVNAGPGMLVTGPLGFASNVVELPFRAMSGIFPASGDIATNPLVLIGAPLHAIGDIVQVPFRIIGAPFGGTTIATY